MSKYSNEFKLEVYNKQHCGYQCTEIMNSNSINTKIK